jgi:hypothetical protein
MSCAGAIHAAALAGLLVLNAPGADWRNTLNVKPGKFPALRPLTAHYEFGWSGVKAAEAEAKFSRGKSRYQLDFTAKTTGAPRVLWQMDTDSKSSVNTATLRPQKLEQSERYASKSIRTTVNFKSDGATRIRTPNPADKTPPKLKRFQFGRLHDLHSAFLFLRSQRLRDGDTVRLCVYPAASAYLAEVTVLGHSKVSAAGKEWDAVRCDLKLRTIDRKFALSPYSKFKRATAWISDDADRLLLRVEADVFIGSVWAELKAVEFSQ